MEKDLEENDPVFWIATRSYFYLFVLKEFCIILCKSVFFFVLISKFKYKALCRKVVLTIRLKVAGTYIQGATLKNTHNTN